MRGYLSNRGMERVDTVRDMAQRVLDNGGEPNYAGEKLHRAFTETLALLRQLGVTREEVCGLIDREYGS